MHFFFNTERSMASHPSIIRDESDTFSSVKRALLDCVLIVVHTYFFLVFFFLVLFAIHSVAEKSPGDNGGWRLIIVKKNTFPRLVLKYI